MGINSPANSGFFKVGVRNNRNYREGQDNNSARKSSAVRSNNFNPVMGTPSSSLNRANALNSYNQSTTHRRQQLN